MTMKTFTTFNPMKILSKFILASALCALAISCNKEPELSPYEQDIPQDGLYTYTFATSISEVKTKVSYSDDIHDPTNPGGADTFSMRWDKGDVITCLRWPEDTSAPIEDYFTLTVAETSSNRKVSLSGTASFTSPLKDGERFVLVHGPFILGGSNDKRAISFPVSSTNSSILEMLLSLMVVSLEFLLTVQPRL